MKIQFGQIELARGLALRESPRQFTVETTRETQVAAAVRAAAAQALDRGNARTLVRFAVTRRHDSLEDALYFACTHAAQLADTATVLALVLEDGAATAAMYLNDAALRGLRCAPTGLATDTMYDFIGGEITSSPTRG